MTPYISICIPAFKRIDFLKRLLNSISIQTFRDFEVVLADDSPGNEVEAFCHLYSNQFPITYIKNKIALGTPENWNESIRHAKGHWIKLMHDDDWFYNESSLQKFAEATKVYPNHNFFFSAYANVYEGTDRVQNMFLKPFWKRALLKNPNIVIADNVIGPPSVTLHKNDGRVWYDHSMKYIVDIDFYIRFLENSDWFYIDKPLINVGINSAQVTKYTFGVAEVHLKEALQLLNKTGEKELKNILVFDAWWRLIRNFSIRNTSDIYKTGFDGKVPEIIKAIISVQRKLPAGLLKFGPFSKAMMSICYLSYRHKIQKR